MIRLVEARGSIPSTANKQNNQKILITTKENDTNSSHVLEGEGRNTFNLFYEGLPN
jgi:hypothetical protein